MTLKNKGYRMLRIEDSIYYIKDEFYSIEAPKLLKKLVQHPFSLMVKISPVVGGKQVKRKKKYSFGASEISMLEAVQSIRHIPADMKNNLINGTDVRTKVMTLNTVWEEFLEYKLTTTIGKQWRYSTAKSTKSTYDKWIRDTRLGSMNIDKIKRRHIIELLEDVDSINTKHALLSAIRPAIDRYFEIEEIDKLNPAHVTGLKQSKPKEHTRLTIAQAGKLYKAMLNTDNRALRNATILVWQGRRLNEAITLSYANVFCNLDTKEQYYIVTEENNKTKIAVTYRLPDELCVDGIVDNSSTYTEQSRNEYARLSSEWVCPSRFRGKPHITKSVLRDGYLKALKDLGMPRMRLHDLRQIISSILQEAETPLEIISMVLGHAGKNNITKRYAGHSPDVAYKAYKFFVELITGVVDADTKWSSL